MVNKCKSEIEILDKVYNIQDIYLRLLKIKPFVCLFIKYNKYSYSSNYNKKIGKNKKAQKTKNLKQKLLSHLIKCSSKEGNNNISI